MKNNTQVILKLSLNVVGDSNNENKFPHILLLTNMQVSKLPNAFANTFSGNNFITIQIKLTRAIRRIFR